MKAIGIVRKLDKLHRLVIPQEICNTHDLEAETPLEIYTDGQDIILRKYQPGCTICGAMDITGEVCGKRICKACARRIAEVFENV